MLGERSGGEGVRDYIAALKKRARMIFGVTASIVFLALALVIILPEAYESEAVIQLGQVNTVLVYKPEEALTLLQSSSILNPVIDRFYGEEEEMTLEYFRVNNLEAEIFKERITPAIVIVEPFLRIKCKTDDPVKSRDVCLAVIDGFLNFTNVEFNKQRDVITAEYDTPTKMARETRNRTVEDIKRKIRETDQQMLNLKKDISDLDSMINSLSESNLDSEGVSKIMLLRGLLDSYKGRLETKEDSRVKLDTDMVMADIDLTQQLATSKLELDKKLAKTREFKVINEPTVQIKSYSLLITTAILSSILGLLFAITLALAQERS